MWTLKSGPGGIWGGGRPTGPTSRPWLQATFCRPTVRSRYVARSLMCVKPCQLWMY